MIRIVFMLSTIPVVLVMAIVWFPVLFVWSLFDEPRAEKYAEALGLAIRDGLVKTETYLFGPRPQ